MVRMSLFFYFALFWFSFSVVVAGPAPPYNLQCDLNFVGLSKAQLEKLNTHRHFVTENPRPYLSWTVAHSKRAAYQTAFRVVVSRDSQFREIVWDTDVVRGKQQRVQYGGEKLARGQVYVWKVTWWDQEGNSAQSKETGHFLSVTDLSWKNVSWITQPSGKNVANGYKFVKKINVTKTVKNAMLYISGLGYFRAFLNSQDLHTTDYPHMYLVPGWTNYEMRVGYMALDVTNFTASQTQIVLTVVLGEGWRDTASFPAREHLKNVTDANERVLRVQLEMNFTDGSSAVVKSDKTWEVHTFDVMQSSIYNGETYDATIQDSIVGMADEVSGPAGTMYMANIPPIVQLEQADPLVQSYRLKKDSNQQILDFGYNVAGVLQLSVKDIKAGGKITMKHAEVLMHPPYGAVDGSLYTDNLRGAQQLDTYVSSGKETVYQPLFTYHGFRYVSLSGYPRDITANDVKRVRITTKLSPNSNFKTSVKLLQTLQENVMRGHASNFMTVPTDCDQRDERLGWMGDNGLSADAMVMNFHLESYFPHRMLLIRDEQVNGSIPDVTPFYHGGGRPADPSWGAVYPQIAWVLLKQYGDKDTAQEFYPSLMEYLNFMESQVPSSGISQLKGRYGDWVPPPPHKKIDTNFPSAFSYMLNIQQMIDIAKALKQDKDVDDLTKRFQTHAAEFNKGFLTSNDTYWEDLQISYALPLFLGIVPDDVKDKVSARFVNYFTGVDKYHITAGIVGTKYILPVLTSLKQNSAATSCVTSVDYPSYGYMIHSQYEPATTIWELWNGDTAGPGMNSRNHHMFSSVSGWMQTDMIGFKQVEGTYGYEEIDLYPASALELSDASISLDHPRPIKYSWHRRGGSQCGKAAEDRSSLNPGLPKHGGLVLSCGEGVITKVVFASYGNPTGECGGYLHHGNCHSTKSMEIVEKLCLKREKCRIPTDAEYWDDPCLGTGEQVAVKWLTVEVQCSLPNTHEEVKSRYTSLNIDLSIPVHSTAHLNVPAYGLDKLEVWDGDTLVYYNDGLLVQSKNGVTGAKWLPEQDLLKLDLTSGDYSFTVRGQAPNETKTVTMYGGKENSNTAELKCMDSRNVISHIDWMSYGNPTVDEYGLARLGEYHSHAGKMLVEKACLGKGGCNVHLDKDLFFAGTPLQYKEANWDLILKYSCNYRQ